MMAWITRKWLLVRRKEPRIERAAVSSLCATISCMRTKRGQETYCSCKVMKNERRGKKFSYCLRSTGGKEGQMTQIYETDSAVNTGMGS